LSEIIQQPILFSWNSSPGIFDGKRKLVQYLCKPSQVAVEVTSDEENL